MRITSILIVFAILLASCSKKQTSNVEDIISTNNLEEIRKKKSELDRKQQEITLQINELNKKISELDTNKKIPLITTLTTTAEVYKHYVELQGDVKTKKNVLVYPEIQGVLEKVFVKEGDRVIKGQVIAKIDDGGLSEQLAQMEATANLAKTTYERQKRLWEQKIGSEIQFLQAETNYISQKNAVDQMKKMLEKSEVVAPFNGIIDDVIKEEGTVVAPGPGAELFRIVNLQNMYIETDVPESYLPSVTKGSAVEVSFPILGKRLLAKVRQTGNFIDPANRTFKVQIDIPNVDSSIKPNLTSKLKINDYTNEEAILIPQSVISENAKGQQYIYKVENLKDSIGVVKQVIIKTGKAQGDFIEVLDGLSVGDQIVEEGARTVKNNQEVKVLKKESLKS